MPEPGTLDEFHHYQRLPQLQIPLRVLKFHFPAILRPTLETKKGWMISVVGKKQK